MLLGIQDEIDVRPIIATLGNIVSAYNYQAAVTSREAGANLQNAINMIDDLALHISKNLLLGQSMIVNTTNLQVRVEVAALNMLTTLSATYGSKKFAIDFNTLGKYQIMH